MRVLALITDGFGIEGGIARYNADLLNAFAQLDSVRQVVCLPRATDFSQSLPSKVLQLKPVRGRFLYVLRATATAVLGGKFDLVYCGHSFMAPLAALLAWLLGLPLWITAHGLEAWDRPGTAVRWAFSRATLVTAVSRFTRTRVLRWSTLPRASVRVLPNTFAERFSPGLAPAELERRYRRAGGKVLLSVCRLDATDNYKGVDRVIEALSTLIDRHPGLTYVVVGDGTGRPDLERLAAQRGVSSRVYFAGRVTDEELVGYYRVADVFVLPSTKEGFGIVFLEAAASGLPIIGGNGDGTLDALADGMLGTVIDPRDATRLSQAINAALEPLLRPKVGVSRFCVLNFNAHVHAIAKEFLGA